MLYERHFFVCMTNRPPMAKPSCGPKNATGVLQALQEQVEAHDLWQKVGVTGCACLGPCENGPNMVVYPEGVWYAGVTEDDVPEIAQSHMLNGQPVERLRYTAPQA